MRPPNLETAQLKRHARRGVLEDPSRREGVARSNVEGGDRLFRRRAAEPSTVCRCTRSSVATLPRSAASFRRASNPVGCSGPVLGERLVVVGFDSVFFYVAAEL